VYEDQFIEFASPLPENYNLYGLGEVIHGFRLGNNLTSKPGTRAMFSNSADSPRNSLCRRRSRQDRCQHLRQPPRLSRHEVLRHR
jgi:hypothetical protein